MEIMTKPRHSIDGFIPRRPYSGETVNRYEKMNRQTGFLENPSLPSAKQQSNSHEKLPGLEYSDTAGLLREDIDASLREIDDDDVKPKQTGRKLRIFRPHITRRKVKLFFALLIIIGLVAGGWLGFKALSSVNSVFGGDLLGLVQRKPLKQDANGRSNVLIFGTSEDSADHIDGGPLLTDSIMVLSVNQEKKDAFMISIPRDLWIKFDEPCSVGYQEKINSVYQCGSNFGEDPEAGAKALQKKVGEILGLDIQYYGHVDYSVLRRSVDAVGGVEVTIESNPPGMGILDRNFDWKCNYQCYYVKYEDGEKVLLDGEHALALSRARNAQGGYGLAAGNFDREKNQQKILKALREKALSVGTLTNIRKVTELLDAMGDNLKTNVDTSEIQTIMALVSEIDSGAIVSLTLNDEEVPLVTTGSVGSASAVMPVAGLFEYSKIRAYIAKAASIDAATREGAKIVVLNGSGVFGAAQKESDWLEERGFTVERIDNAPEGEYLETKIYQRNQSMTATKEKLASVYNISVETASPVPFDEDVDFLIILGENHPPRGQ